MTETERPASLTAFGYPARDAVAFIVEQGPAQRLFRAVAGLGLFWGLALGGLFIPVAHLILVPTFTAVGIIVAIKRAAEDRRLLRVRGACPRCGVVQEFAPGGRLVSGRSFDCPSCHGNVTLVAESAPRGA
ncbi:MAG TPA: hypothetical protein VMS64_27685 [Candidatus Methylomirabilis sp.]|nr:hypothetical protein [Candidatus Methylomirabilis sp.]